jgi:hypothetical protein
VVADVTPLRGGKIGLQLPRNVAAEQSVLGGIILRPDLLADPELEDIEADHFYDFANKVVFQAMRNLVAASRPIDIVTLEVEIGKMGRLEALGGVGYLGQLALRVPTPDNVATYAAELRILRRNRLAQVAIASALERSKTWPHDPVELVSELAGELQRIEVDHGIAEHSRKERWCIPLEQYLGDEEPDDDDSSDWIIRDLIPRAEPALWGGPMKGGKTWGALDLCLSVALGRPWLGRFENTLGGPARVLGIFLEDNKRRLRKRLWELCRARGTTPNCDELRANLRISRAPLRLPDSGDQRRLVAEVKTWGAVLVVIDNLTRVMVGDPNSPREAAAFTKAWTAIGEETGACIAFLHHTKKPSGDVKAVDPFDLLRGSGDFGATARNIIVTTPIRTENTDKLSEVRMRGNLDLRCESFTLGFERAELMGRWQARLVDRGEIETVRDEVKRDRKDAKEIKRRDELARETEHRRSVAIAIATKEGSVSSQRLATELGLASPRTTAPILIGLVQGGILQPAGRRGYELAGADRQEVLP